MLIKIPKKIKKAIKPTAKVLSSIIYWILLFIYSYILKSNKHHIPTLIAMLSQNEWLVFNIKPELIKYHIKEPYKLPDNLFVWTGDWDKDVYDLREHEKYKLVRELVAEKKEYSDIEYYSYSMEKIKMNDPVIKSGEKLDSEQKVIQYFEKQKKVFEDIKANGFNLNKASETGVAISRDGSLLHYRQGHHTLAMAKILGIKEVKIRIRAVHKIWLLKQINAGGLNFLRSIQKAINDYRYIN